jgi:hypothetical protein
MKVLWGTFSFLFFVCAILHAGMEEAVVSVLSSTPSEVRVEIELPPLQMRGKNINTMRMGNLETLERKGFPPLPFVSGMVAIDDRGAYAATIEQIEAYRIKLEEGAIPCERSYPEKQLTLDTPGILRDFRTVRFQYIPVQLLPETNELKVTTRVTISIRKTAPKGKNEKSHGRE